MNRLLLPLLFLTILNPQKLFSQKNVHLDLSLESSPISLINGMREDIKSIAGIYQPIGFQFNAAFNISINEKLSYGLGVNTFSHKSELDYYFHANEYNTIFDYQTHYDFKFVFIGFEPHITYRQKKWEASFGIGIYQRIFSKNATPQNSNYWMYGGMELSPSDIEVNHVNIRAKFNSPGTGFSLGMASFGLTYSLTPNWFLGIKTYLTIHKHIYYYSDVTVLFSEESNRERIDTEIEMGLPRLSASLSIVYRLNMQTIPNKCSNPN